MLMVPAKKCGRPRSLDPPPTCETCRRRLRPCGSGCADWPRAGWAAVAAQPASATRPEPGVALPTARVRKQRDWDAVPEHPSLRFQATGIRWRPAGRPDPEGEEAVPPDAAAAMPDAAQEEQVAVALLQLGSVERRCRAGRADRAAWVRSLLLSSPADVPARWF